MFWLVRKLLPYLLVFGGAILLLGTLPAIFGEPETTPTTVALADVTSTAPKARWLNLTGGGIYLPDAIVDEQIKKKTGARKVKAYYVPYVLKDDAQSRARELVGGDDVGGSGAAATPATAPAPQRVVLVLYRPDDFLRTYPTPDRLQPGDVFRPTEVQGVRSSNVLFPERLKDYVRAEMKVPLDSVVVIKAGDKPLQRADAIKMAGVLGVIVLIGLVWSVARFRRRPTPNLPPPPPFTPGPPPLRTGV